MRVGTIMAVAVALGALCAPMSAEAKASKAEMKKSKFHIRLGAGFFKKGKYPEALAEMRKAYALVPLPGHIYNMARCYQEMGRLGEAVEYFHRYLDEGDDKKKLKKTQAALSELIPKVFGALEVSCQPAGVAVEIPGVGGGPCPYVNEQVRAGGWKMKLSAEGYTTAELDVTVEAGGRAKIEHRLERPGMLTVTSEPPGAEVVLGDRSRGETPLKDLKVDAGKYELRLRLKGWREAAREVEVAANEGASVAVELEPRGGLLALTSEPGGASVFLDGERVGVTPLSKLKIREGKHALRLEAGLRVPWHRTVEVEDKAALEMHAQLPSTLPSWLLAGAAALAAAGAGATLMSARSAYDERDDVLARYQRAEDASSAGELGDEVRAKESSGDSLLLVSRALLGVALATGGAAGWFFATTPDQVGATW